APAYASLPPRPPRGPPLFPYATLFRSMRVSCQPLGHRDIAGVRAQGLRYSGARGRGPGASDRGQMWFDPASGLVVSYEARTRDRKTRRMRATEVRREPLPPALFELPTALQPR